MLSGKIENCISISLRLVYTLDVAYVTLQTILDFYAKFVRKKIF